MNSINTDDRLHDTIAAAIERDDDDGSEARRHLAAGRAICVGDPCYPGQVVRIHPNGLRELMRLDVESGTLVVVGTLDRTDDLAPKPR